MKKSQSITWLFIAILFAAGVTTLILSSMVTDPSNMMIGLGGDCGKNYFTFIYHSIYDHGIWFWGMNYPYGEHIIYADGQPVLSTFLSCFTHLSARQALAVMNLAIAFSYVVAIVFTYKILLRFGVKPFIAILFACLINLLSPQVMKARAHFALSYLCVVPVLFYCSVLFHYTRKWQWAFCIFVFGFIMSFIHLYFGAFFLLWLAFYSLGCLLFIKGSLRYKFKYAGPALVTLAVLFLSIKMVIAFTDPITDRPSYPMNSLQQVSHIKDIVTSPFSPMWQYLHEKHGFNRLSEAGEGYGYLGIVTIITVFISSLMILVRGKKRKSDEPIISEANFSPVWLFIAFCSLLMAMGVPFIWHLEWTLEYLSLFKQFRSMGRFNWIFFYIISIYAVVVIYNWYEKNRQGGRLFAAYAVLLICLLTWALEVSGYVKYTRGYIAQGAEVSDQFFQKNDIKWPEYLVQHHLNASDFQAILLSPFFACGSEKISPGGDPGGPLSVGLPASVALHLPIIDIMMSRTSWSLTEKQVKTVAGPYADKPMLRDLQSNKPFLWIKFDGAEVNQDEDYLLQASDYIGRQFQSYIYACYPERIKANDRKNADSIAAILPYMHSADTCLQYKGTWYINHFDEGRNIPHIFGAGGAAAIAGETKLITTIPVTPMRDGQLYELSAWFLLRNDDFRSPSFHIQILDSTGKAIQALDALTLNSFDNVNMWFRTSVYFHLPAQCRSIACNLVNLPDPAYIAMDELLLRPADAVIISKAKDGKVMVNNHRLIRNNKQLN